MSGLSTYNNFVKLMTNSKIKYEIVILEAKNEIGGRTKTKTFSSKYQIDLGATWLEGYSDENPVAQLSKKYKLTPCSTLQTGSLLTDDEGKLISNKKLKENQKLFEKVRKNIKKMQKDISYKEAIEISLKETKISFDDSEEYFNHFVENLENYEGENIDKISILSKSDCGHPGRIYQLIEGYGTISKMYSKGLNIKLNQIVKKIDYSDEKIISVETEEEKFEVDFVVCTISLGCLKNEIIEFNPSLPKSKLQIIDKIGFGLLDKIILEFPKNFWGNYRFIKKLEKKKDEEIHSFYCLDAVVPNCPILVSLISADFARKIENLKDDEVIENAMKSLRLMFGNSIPEPIDYEITRWWNDPFSFGSYSYDAVGGSLNDFDELGKSIEERLLFAGESTISRGHSFVNGAYLSGERAAKELYKYVQK
eukprot:gene1270-11357_t